MRRPNSRWFCAFPNLSITTKLFAVVTLVVTMVVAVFGVLDYRYEKTTLEVFHQFLMQSGPAGLGIAQTQEHQHHLALIRAALTRSGVTHLIHWGATVIVLVLALQWAVNTIIIRPARQIIGGLNVIKLGTWNLDLPVSSGDELGQLTRKLNEVGREVSHRVDEWRGAERLSTLALISTSIVTDLRQISSEIRMAARMLKKDSGKDGSTVHPKLIASLDAQALRLEAIESDLDGQFLRTLESVRAGRYREEVR